MINMLGTEATFEILNVMEYSSARGRMSVIARSAEGGVRLLSKGSDSKVMRILGKGVPKALLDATNQNLHLFATQVSSTAERPPFARSLTFYKRLLAVAQRKARKALCFTVCRPNDTS